MLGMSRDTAYSMAGELGAVRLGAGPRGRLRFDAERVAEALTARSAGKGSDGPERRVPARSASRPVEPVADLLPVRRPMRDAGR
jgi:hypothetical protein